MDPAFLFADRPDAVPRVREALGAAGYTTAAVRAAVGADGAALLARDELDPCSGGRGRPRPSTRSCASSCARRPCRSPTPSGRSSPCLSPRGRVLDEAWLRLDGGLCASGSIDPDAIGTDPGDLFRQALPTVHQLIERGYLLPPVAATWAPGDQ